MNIFISFQLGEVEVSNLTILVLAFFSSFTDFLAAGFLAAGFLAAGFFDGGLLAGIIRQETSRLWRSFQ